MLLDLLQKLVRAKVFKPTGDFRYVFSSKLEKACFSHDLAYGVNSDLAKRFQADRLLRDEAFDVAKNA